MGGREDGGRWGVPLPPKPREDSMLKQGSQEGCPNNKINLYNSGSLRLNVHGTGEVQRGCDQPEVPQGQTWSPRLQPPRPRPCVPSRTES